MFSLKTRQILKSIIAFWLACFVPIVPWIHDRVGHMSFACPIVAIMFDNSRTTGAHLELAFYDCLGLMVAILYYSLYLAVYIQYNIVGGDSTGGLLISLAFSLVSLFLIGWFKITFHRFYLPSLLTAVVVAICMALTPMGVMDFNEGFKVVLEMALPCFLGIVITTIVNLTIWPKTAAEGVTSAIDQVLVAAGDSLSVSIERLNSEQCIQSKFPKLQSEYEGLARIFEEATFEMTYGVHPHCRYEPVVKVLGTIVQYLGALDKSVRAQYELKSHILSEKRISRNSHEVIRELADLFVDPLQNLNRSCQYAITALRYNLDLERGILISHLETSSLAELELTFAESLKEFEKLEQYYLDRATSILKEQTYTTDYTATFNKHRPVLIAVSSVIATRQFGRELLRCIKTVGKLATQRPIERIRVYGYWGIKKYGKRKTLWRSRVKWHEWLRSKKQQELPNNSIHPITKWPAPDGQPPNKSNYSIRHGLLKIKNFFTTKEAKFALKFSLCVNLIICPSYILSFHDYYSNELHGFWAVLNVIFILNQTAGLTMYLGLLKLIGTTLGGIWGYLAILASLDHDLTWPLILMLIIISIPSWLIIMNSTVRYVGVNSLMTFLVILFLEDGQADLATTLKLSIIRIVMVIASVILAGFVNLYLWPYSPIDAFRKNCASIFTNQGVHFGNLFGQLMVPGDDPYRAESILLKQEQLAHHLVQTTSLVPLLELEPPSLQPNGKFKLQQLQKILPIAQDIMHHLVSISDCIQQIPLTMKFSLTSLNPQRGELVSNTILYFYVLAKALATDTKLPPYPPDICNVRDRIINALQNVIQRDRLDNKHVNLPQSLYGGGSSSTANLEPTCNRNSMVFEHHPSLTVPESLASPNNSTIPPSPAMSAPHPPEITSTSRPTIPPSSPHSTNNSLLDSIYTTSDTSRFQELYWYTLTSSVIHILEDIDQLAAIVSSLVGVEYLTLNYKP